MSAILFDKDGTLLDYRRSWGPINLAAASLGARGDPELAAHLLAVGGARADSGMARPDSVLAAGSAREIAEIWVHAGAPHSVSALTQVLDEVFRASVDSVVPVTELVELFARLKSRGLRLGIASSDSEQAIRATAERFGLTTLVDFVAGYDSGFGVKPGPGMLLGFCRAVGVRPEATAVVGDNAHDMDMATSGGAGLRVGVLTGTGTRASLNGAHVCLDSIADLEALIFA